jgi:hypothetical protein
MKGMKMLLIIYKYWMNKKANQQQLHPQQQHHHFPFFVLRATNHNPVGKPFENAWAAARSSTATRIANERIGVQEGTNKNADD